MTYTLLDRVDNFANAYKGYNKSTFSAENNWARAKSFVCVPGSFVASILDTCRGVPEGLIAGLPIAVLREMGYANKLAEEVFLDAEKHISHSRLIVADPFKHLLQTINPKVLRNDEGCISMDGDGFIASGVGAVVESLTKTKSSLYRHTVSRLVYALAPIALVIARIADAIIGLVAAPLALLSCGIRPVPFLNHLAYRGLQAPGLISDLYQCAIGFINPPDVQKKDNDGLVNLNDSDEYNDLLYQVD